jgi:hypothetical protein
LITFVGYFSEGNLGGLEMKIVLLIIIVSALLGVAFLGLAIQIIFKKGHKFPNFHVSGNKNLAKKGITCAQSWDKMEQKKAKEDNKYKNLTLEN